MRRLWFRVLVVLALAFRSRAALPQGAPLGPEFRVNTYTTGSQAGPLVAADPAGNFVVVWETNGEDGSFYGIFGQRYAASGTPLGPEFRVNTYTTANQYSPAVTADGSGNFVVVWANQAGIGGIFGQRFASSGAPLGGEFRVNTYTTNYKTAPAVASDASGNFVVAWTSYKQDGSLWGIYGQRFDSSGAPLGPEFRVNTVVTNGQYDPQVAADPSGSFVVVWDSVGQDGSLYGIFGQRFAASGAPLGPEFRVNTFTTNNQFVGSVAADASGNFVTAWSSFGQDGSLLGVFGQRFSSSGAPLGGEFRVNTYTTNTQAHTGLAMDGAGNFVVVWHGGQDSYSILGQRFASSGVPLGPEFRVNTYTTGYQVAPSVAADASGNFVVVWRSDVQDGSGYGVFGQRFGPILPVELMGFGVQ